MKIVVTGPFEAGKSLMIHNITNGACINIERGGTTIAMDHGLANVDGMNVFMFGTPGLLRFRTMRKILSEGADGIIFVVDSVDPESDKRAKLFFREIAFFLPGVPCVVAANKQDDPKSRPVDSLRKNLRFLAGLPVFPVSAKTGENVDSMLRTLLYLVMMQWSSVFGKFAEYNGVPDGLRRLMQDLNLEREQAVGYLRRFELRKLLEVQVGDEQFVIKDAVRNLLENPVTIMRR
ncbi:MAG: GTP-binding protein [Candidatus Thorarchaeota archaeon]|jgi:small GTP-binding protein|nr:GTP-binding protein [Candidatus Thorarchaeota archaeon]